MVALPERHFNPVWRPQPARLLSVVVEAPQIELVENATHPLVLGSELLTYLNQLVATYHSHLHPGQVLPPDMPITPAPPIPPFPPAPPGLLSPKVKTG